LTNNKKKRVFQVAREFNMSNEALILYLEKLNFNVRNHMSLITEDMYQEVATKFSSEIDISEKDVDFKQQLKEKRARDEEKKMEAQRKYEEKVRTSILIMSEKPGVRKVVSRAAAGMDLPPSKEIDMEEEIAVIEHPETELEKSAEDKSVKTHTPIIEEVEEETVSEDAEKAVKRLIAAERKEKARKKEIEKPKAPETQKEIEQEKIKPVAEKEAITGKKIEKKDVQKEIESKVFHKLEASKDKKEIREKTDEKPPKKKLRKKLKAKERLTKPEAFEEGKDVAKKKKKKRTKAVEEIDVKRDKSKRKHKKRKKILINEAEVEESIKQTLVMMEDGGRIKRRKKRVKADSEIPVTEEENVLKVHEFLTVAELATEMDEEASAVIKKCMELGMMVSINNRLDEDAIMTVADEFGFNIEIIPEYGSEKFEEIEEKDVETFATLRPPVVTIMGHVDHGKTSLLDYIRESNIARGETGGITQHIGAYEVNVDGKSITFLDTPGHEAFTAMRARGAQATDIVILVVAADDSVMPQTIEAINHAKAAGVPIIVAINKIDKPNADVEKIKKQLAEHDVLIESWGGKYQSVEISAKTGEGINRLLESILVEAEVLELTANPNRLAHGVIIESKLDKGKGIIATVLVQKGTLKIGDPFIAGQYSGKVRSLFNDLGKRAKNAGPSTPVIVLGFSGLPQAGDTFIVLESEKDTKEISFRRQQVKREQDFRRIKHITLDEISRRIKEGQVKELSIILKGDVDGSVEAIGDSLLKLSTDEVAVKIIHKGVGAISESDVLLASTSDAVILGFQVRPTIKAREVAQREKVDVRLYKVIYDVISDVKDALEGLLEPTLEENNLGTVEVRETFKVPKIGTIAGCYVLTGKVTRNDLIRLYREDKLIYEGKLNSLRRFKDDAREVAAGFECGIGLENFDDIKVGDVLETYEIIQVKRKLEK